MITIKNIEEFLNNKQLNNVFNSQNTVRAYRARLTAWQSFSSGIDDINNANRYLEYLVSIHGSKTVKSTLYILKSFYDWLGVPENPFDKLSTQYRTSKKEAAIKKLDRDNHVYSGDEISRLLAHARSKTDALLGTQNKIDYYLAYRNWFMIFLLSEYGMRISGLVGTDISHIDIENRYMTIYDSKNGEPYPVPLKSNLSSLRSYMAVRHTIMGYIINGNPALFLSKTGKRLSDTSARRAINDLAAEIGLYDAGRSTHQLRHYRATRYFADGMPLDLISIVMGVSVQVLKSTYLHLTEADTVRQYESWLDRKQGGFTCPRCGYGQEDQKKTGYDKSNLRIIQ
uniref:Putative site-specific tyrosine recombinase n=1 Tax=viral metagenome TaxID=1070528 RepID=A0A6M3ILT6_9ZZZZ